MRVEQRESSPEGDGPEPPPEARRERRRRRRRPLLRAALAVLGILCLFVAVDLFLLLRPAQVRAHATSVLAGVFRGRIEIGECHFDPIRGFSCEDVTVWDVDGKTPFLQIDEARVVPSYWPLGAREVVCRGVRLHLVRTADGVWNADRVIRPGAGPTGPGPPGPATLRSFRVDDLRIIYRDDLLYPEGTYHQVPDISLHLASRTEESTIVRGEVGDPRIGQPSFSLTLPAEGAFRANLDLLAFDVTPSFRRFLPRDAREIWDALRPTGLVSGQVTLSPSGSPTGLPDMTGRLTVRNATCNLLPFPYPFRNVQATIRFQPGKIFLENIRGGEGDARYEADGVIDLGLETDVQLLDLTVDFAGVPLDDRLGAALPPSAAGIWWDLDPSGRGEGRVHVWGPLPEGMPMHFTVNAAFHDASARFRRFPVPIRDLEGELRIENEEVHLPRVSGRAGGGRLHATANVDQDRIGIHIDAEGVQPTPDLLEHLPEEVRVVLARFRPEGAFDTEVSIVGAEPESYRDPDVHIQVVPRDARISFDEFPYPLRVNGRIDVDLGAGRIEVDVEGRRQEVRVAANGSIELWPDEAPESGVRTIDLRISAPEVPLDQALRYSLPPRVRSIYEDLSPRGSIRVEELLIQQEPDDDEPAIRGRLRPLGMEATYAPRPLPLEGLLGTIDFDETEVAFDLRGRLRLRPPSAAGGGLTSPVTISGRSPLGPTVEDGGSGPPPGFEVTIGASDLPLVPEITTVLDEETAEHWRAFHWSGRADATVEARSPPAGEDLSVSVEADLREASLRHEVFPYPLENLWGHLSIDPDGTLRFTDVRARGESVEEVRGRASLAGPEDERTLRLHIEATDLVLDETLRSALPADWREGFAEAEVDGRGDVVWNVLYDLSSEEMFWNGELDLEDGGLTPGIRLEPVVGRLSTHGRSPPEAPTRMEGTVRLDRTAWKGQEVRDLSCRLRLADDRLDLLNLFGRMYGGSLTGEFYTFFESPRFFAGNLSLRDARAGDLARNLFETERDTGGRLEGRLTFAGQEHPISSLQGQGEVHITGARLLQLPTFLSIWGLLSGQPPSQGTFREVHVDVGLEDRVIDVRRAVFDSPALYLEGDGSATYDGWIELALGAELGGRQIGQVPGLSDLWGLVRDNLLWGIEVRGPVESPAVSLLPAPALSDLFLRIFRFRRGEGPPPDRDE